MSRMKVRALPGLYYELSNTLRAKNFWFYVTVSVLLCITQYVQGGVLDGAFGLLVGVDRFSLGDIDIAGIINWLMPHLLLSAYIGECGEQDMRMQRMNMPRYASMRRYWTFQAIKLVVTGLMYYMAVVVISALMSLALGNRMFKISESTLSFYNLYSGTLPNSWLIMLEIVLRAALTMAMVGMIQLALAWLTDSQRWGLAAFAALMLVSMFVTDAGVQRFLPCDLTMYLRGGTVSDGLGLAGVCLICASAMVVTVETLCIAARTRTIVVN
ncbi:MAG: hypothetical protein ACOYIH_08175 [Candidatus Fimadaptatus sp.]